MATKRLAKVFNHVSSEINEAVIVAELGSGYGRNWPLLRETFPQAIILQYE